LSTTFRPSIADSKTHLEPARRSSTEAQGRPTGRYYRPALDALRFFAFFSVFIAHGVEVNFHAGVLHSHPGIAHAVDFLRYLGGFGLSLFFFLSSFLISTLLLLERERTGTVNLKSFYVRRMLRIWPLYVTYMIAAFLIGRMWLPAWFSGHALLAYFTLSANWFIIVTGTVSTCVQFLWSISVEEQFYLVWPVLLRFLTRRGMHILCVSLIAVSLAGTGVLAATHSSGINLWFNSLSESLFFACGGLLALFVGLKQQPESWWRWLAGVGVCAVCWLSADATGLFDTPNAAVSPARAISFYILAAGGAAALVWGFLHIPRRLILPQLVYLGRISFGLYVFHGMTMLLGRQFIAPWFHGGLWLIPTFALTVVVAALSYEFLEKPFLKLKYRFELVHSRTP
jgi:peptidoglycan/LPS O-acetylase OafA/YrhL